MSYRMPRRRTAALSLLAGPILALAAPAMLAAASITLAGQTEGIRPGGTGHGSTLSYRVPGLAPGLSAVISMPPAGRSGPEATGPRYTLTITGTNLAGQPASGGTVFVCNTDDSRRYCNGNGPQSFRDGSVRFRLPVGRYWAVALFVDLAHGKATAGHIVVLPQFTVSGNSTVHLAESTASSKITMVTPRPATELGTAIDIQHTAAAGPQAEFATAADARVPVWISPTRQRPSVGTLRFGAEQWLASPPGKGTPYRYDLAYRSAGVIPAQRHVVRPGSLATVDERFYGAPSSAGSSQPDAWFPHENVGADVPLRGFAVPVPGRRIDYFSGNPSILWNGYYSSASGSESALGRTFRPGERLTDDWGRYPLHPAPVVNLAGAAAPVPVVPSAYRIGDLLSVDAIPFTDSTPGHISYGFFPPAGPQATGSFEIDQNGKKIAAGNAAAYGFNGPHVTLSPRPSVIRFVLNAARTGPHYPLSASSHTVWTWRSRREPSATVPRGWGCFLPGAVHPARHCSVQPMMTLGYRVAGLALTGSARPGRQALAVTAGHLQLAPAARITKVGVQVSFDSGRHWHSAAVTGHGSRYLASYTAPAGRYVTLRTTARDAAGGQITETITRAYRIRD